jgi:hypothetical protein
MCGSYDCPHCGPALGANPVFELVCEWLGSILDGIDEYDDLDDIVEEMANRLGAEPAWFVEAIEKRAADWAREQKEKIKRLTG